MTTVWADSGLLQRAVCCMAACLRAQAIPLAFTVTVLPTGKSSFLIMQQLLQLQTKATVDSNYAFVYDTAVSCCADWLRWKQKQLRLRSERASWLLHLLKQGTTTLPLLSCKTCCFVPTYCTIAQQPTDILMP